MKIEKTLEEWRQVIGKEGEYADVRSSYSHIMIDIALGVIAQKYGQEEAHKAVLDFGLDQKGW